MDDPRGVQAEAGAFVRFGAEKKIGFFELEEKTFIENADAVEDCERDHQARAVGVIERVEVGVIGVRMIGGVLRGVELAAFRWVAKIDGGMQQARAALVQRVEHGVQGGGWSERGGLPQAVGPGGVVIAADATCDAWIAAFTRLWDDEVAYRASSNTAREYARSIVASDWRACLDLFLRA